MAIQLYRKGSSHTVRGIECEVCNFAPASLDGMLADGWVTSPEELSDDNAQIEESSGNDEESTEEKSEDEKEDAEKALNPIRIKAQLAGIDGWDTKRIKTLELLLEA